MPTNNQRIKMIPLKEFICDKCGKVLALEDGYLEFMSGDGPFTEHDFKIVHNNFEMCEAHGHPEEIKTLSVSNCSIELTEFFSKDAACNIVSIIEESLFNAPPNITVETNNVRDYIEFIRRVKIPYYEEARQYIASAQEDELFGFRYSEENLINIINRYSEV